MGPGPEERPSLPLLLRVTRDHASLHCTCTVSTFSNATALAGRNGGIPERAATLG